jgi:hypothetical protein
MRWPAVDARQRARRARQVLTPYGPLIVLVGASTTLALMQLRPGHDWGDDFSLYIDQARSLVEGDVGAVLDRTRYTVQNSSWNTFSPYTYPWGFPLLLAPLYAVFGLSYTAFKVLVVAAFAGLLVAFHALIRPRLDALAAIALTTFIAFNQSYMGWVNTVLSDLPFACTVMVGLWAIERVFRAARWTGRRRARISVRTWLAVAGVGVIIGFAANVRQEGAVLVGVLGLRQLLTLWAARKESWTLLVPPFLVPYGAAALTWVGLRAALPAEAGPALELSGGLGKHNWDVNITFYRQFLGDVFGLRGWMPDAWVSAVLVAIIVLALGGVVLRWRDDLPLGACFVVLSLLYLSLPYREGRYLYVVIALGAYFAVQALRGLDIPRLVLQPRHLAVLALVALVSRPLFGGVDYWRAFPNAVNGPHTTDATEMWAAVDELTDPSDTVAFFRARTLNLYTQRQGLQLTSLPQILERADWYVMARGSTYSQCLVDDDIAQRTDGRLEKVWQNGNAQSGWVLWRVDRSRPLSAEDMATLPPCLAG